MTGLRHGIPPGYTPPVTHDPVACWRCGTDCRPAFDVIHLPLRTVPVCKGFCVPTVVPPRKEAP